ncbi:hypothetical protein JOQ06_004568, partial [Pogonophryne albipinna]
RSQALITARMMVCQKIYTYQRRGFMGNLYLALFSSSRLQLGKRTCLAVPIMNPVIKELHYQWDT